MPYVTTLRSPKGSETSLDQMLSSAGVCATHKPRVYPGTVTRRCENPPYTAGDIQRLIALLNRLSYLYKVRNLRNEYQIYQIPKRSGGLRTICAPSSELSRDHVELRTLFEEEFFALYHTTAFAYCKGRSIKHCMQRHQANKSRWFLKLDFENFFGNTSKKLVLRQLGQIAPFSEVLKSEEGKQALSKALDICFLDNGLPQGTKISPMLTNLVMIPFDHEINKLLHAKGFVYTRYADDIQISHKHKFNHNEIVKLVESILSDLEYPYQIKSSKTRFGSSSGRNWNLGLMLNKDNKITVGHEEHKRMKARLYSFAMDSKNGKPWSLDAVQRLMGQLAYMKSIEPYMTDHMVDHISKKVGVSIVNLFTANLSSKRAMLDPVTEGRAEMERFINEILR